MAKIREGSIVVTLGVALLATTSPARAYAIEALTSIPGDEAADRQPLKFILLAGAARKPRSRS
jgi:hypothetical protein